MKKIIAGVLALTMVCSVAVSENDFVSNMVNTVSVGAEDNSCGNGVTWKLNNGTLTISGTGAMLGYNIDTYLTPWYDSRDLITKVVIEDGVTSIGAHAFSGCELLTEVTIPDSVTNIDSRVFSNCTSLTEITIPDSVVRIGSGAFSETPFLENQTTDVKYVGKWAVDCNKDVTEVEIKPDTVGIADSAFSDCISLTTAKITNSVEIIGNCAFSGCTSLVSVTIPDSITNIGYRVFDNTAIVNNQDTDLKYVDTFLVGCSNDKIESVEIKEGTVAIVPHVFDSCTSLTTVKIPDSITCIGYRAFYNCESLTSVIIPAFVTSIDNDAFGYYIGKNWQKVKVENFTIYGVKGSAAETYAVENGFKFVEIEGTPDETTETTTIEETTTTQETTTTTPETTTTTEETTTTPESTTTEETTTTPETTTTEETTTTPESTTTEETTTTPETTTTEETTTTPETTIEETTTTQEIPIKTGDIDGDGEITSYDALDILQLVVGGEELTEEQIKLADLDGDGEITSSDTLAVLQMIVGLR